MSVEGTDPFSKPPEANKVFASGDKDASHDQAVKVFNKAVDLSKASFDADNNHRVELNRAALANYADASDADKWKYEKAANLNMGLIPEARAAVAAAADEAKAPVNAEFDRALTENYGEGSLQAAVVKAPERAQDETIRQMGIAAADRAQRVAKGMKPPVADLR